MRRPRCMYHTRGFPDIHRNAVRCTARATTSLLHPGGYAPSYAPFFIACREHGELVLAECREPGWRLVDVDEWGRVRE